MITGNLSALLLLSSLSSSSASSIVKRAPSQASDVMIYDQISEHIHLETGWFLAGVKGGKAAACKTAPCSMDSKKPMPAVSEIDVNIIVLKLVAYNYWTGEKLHCKSMKIGCKDCPKEKWQSVESFTEVEIDVVETEIHFYTGEVIVDIAVDIDIQILIIATTKKNPKHH